MGSQWHALPAGSVCPRLRLTSLAWLKVPEVKGDEPWLVNHRVNSLEVLYKAQSKALAVLVSLSFIPTGFQADTEQS